MREATEYDQYIRLAWARFIADPARTRTSLEAVAGINVARVLDVGCGAGQQLLPFVTRLGAYGVGLDPSPEVGHAGRELFAAHTPDARVAFLRGSAERLPFSADSFDVLICRLVLPYTDNVRTLSEFARVLRPGGVLLLKIHHPRFYLRKLVQGLKGRDLRYAVHAARVLLAGVVYHATGKQSHSRLTAGGETFQTPWLLRRELRRQGLRISRELPDTEKITPSFLVIKEAMKVVDNIDKHS
jgi:ubiquinone/menaquinone biosynthesis C-methylase UbiE